MASAAVERALADVCRRFCLAERHDDACEALRSQIAVMDGRGTQAGAPRRDGSIELAIAHANTLGRLLSSAFRVAVTKYGDIEALADAEDAPADLPMGMGLERFPDGDHATDTRTFRAWQGVTSSAFGSFDTRLVLIEVGSR